MTDRSCKPQQRRRRPTVPSEPETVELDLHGHPARFDVLGMRLLGPRDLPERRRPVFPRRQPRLAKLTLETTHRCNLACRYCFVREQHDDGLTMPLKTAQRAFKTLLPRDRDLAISLFGGEPLMAWDLISQFVPWAAGCASERPVAETRDGHERTRSQRVRFHVTTNATLLNHRKVAFLQRYGFSLITSLDGPPHVHNAQRPLAGGQPSYGATLRGLERIGRAGLGKRNTIRATYDLAALDAEPGDDWLLRRMAHLAHLCRRGYAANVSIEPAFASCADVACIRERTEGDGREHIERLEPGYWRAAHWFLQEHREGRPVRFFHFSKFLDRVRERRPQPSECGAGYGVVSIAPDGTICACHRETGTAIGHVDDGAFDEQERAAWLDNRSYARQGCNTCWARYLCGGGCRMDSLLHLADIHVPCPWECEFKKLLVRIALWLDREWKG